MIAELVNHRFLTLVAAALLVMVETSSGSIDAVAQEFKFLEVKVVDDNGKPMADVQVDIKMEGLQFPMPTDEAGMISLNVSAGRSPVELLVRHEGYQSQKIRWRRGSEVPEEFSISLQPGKPASGWVVDAQGEPVAEAEVFAASPKKTLRFVNGHNPPISKQTAVTTDEQGQFTLPFQPAGSTIACLSDAGWAQFVKSDEHDDQLLEIKLTPWARVELLTKLQQTSPDGETVGLHFIKALDKDRGRVEWSYSAQTNENNAFVCNRVVPGTAMAYREAKLQPTNELPPIANRSHGEILALEAGGLTQVILGGAKQHAQGKLILPQDFDGEIDWPSGYVVLTENNAVDLVLRTAIFEYGKLLGQSNVYRPEDRVPPSGRANYLVRYLAPINDDGTFQIENVPAGPYTLSAAVIARPAHAPRMIGILVVDETPCTIVATDSAETWTIDLGEHTLHRKRRTLTDD